MCLKRKKMYNIFGGIIFVDGLFYCYIDLMGLWSCYLYTPFLLYTQKIYLLSCYLYTHPFSYTQKIYLLSCYLYSVHTPFLLNIENIFLTKIQCTLYMQYSVNGNLKTELCFIDIFSPIFFMKQTYNFHWKFQRKLEIL